MIAGGGGGDGCAGGGGGGPAGGDAQLMNAEHEPWQMDGALAQLVSGAQPQ